MSMSERKRVPFEYDGLALEAYVDGENDMRIYDAAAKYGSSHALAVRALAVAMLGDDGYERLERHIADETGFVDSARVYEAALKALEAAKAKN